MKKKSSKPEQMPKGYNGWSLLDGEAGMVVLKNVLHNMSASENGNNHEYSKGVINGVMSALIAGGMNWDDAAQLVWQMLPNDCHPERFPPSWKECFAGKIKETKNFDTDDFGRNLADIIKN